MYLEKKVNWILENLQFGKKNQFNLENHQLILEKLHLKKNNYIC